MKHHTVSIQVIGQSV